jgi:putative endonuclease
MKKTGRYYVYITTNQHRTVLYTGVTNDITRRCQEHLHNALYNRTAFTGRYQAFYLLYYEIFASITTAIKREKEIKGWKRSRKLDLINSTNPDLVFLNDLI